MKAGKDDVRDLKPDYSLIPKSFMDQVSYCMMAGAIKYGRDNYRKGHSFTQLTAAACRHLKCIESGVDIDEDTTNRIGVSIQHWANVACCALMAIEQIRMGTIRDDRYKGELDGKRQETNTGLFPVPGEPPAAKRMS